MANFKKNGHDKNDYLQYIYYKYVEKQTKPGTFVEDTLVKSQQFINSLIDESEDSVNLNFEKQVRTVDEQDVAERQKLITFKQVQAYLMRKSYIEGKLPEAISREKKDAYDKSIKKIQLALAMYEKKKSKIDSRVIDRLFLYFIEMYHMMVLVVYECSEVNTLNGHLMYELLSQIEMNEDRSREWVSKLWEVNDRFVKMDTKLREKEKEIHALKAERDYIKASAQVKEKVNCAYFDIADCLKGVFN